MRLRYAAARLLGWLVTGACNPRGHRGNAPPLRDPDRTANSMQSRTNNGMSTIDDAFVMLPAGAPGATPAPAR